MVKRGQIIGMGTTDVGLMVEVQEVTPHTMRGWVINGAWELHYNLSTALLACDKPSGTNHFTTHILFTSPLPRGMGDYNEAIEYMNDHLKSRWYTRLWNRAYMAMISRAHRVVELPTRLRNAIRGMRDGWSRPLVVKTLPVDYDDGIPF